MSAENRMNALAAYSSNGDKKKSNAFVIYGIIDRIIQKYASRNKNKQYRMIRLVSNSCSINVNSCRIYAYLDCRLTF